jgi:hypothetical protein
MSGDDLDFFEGRLVSLLNTAEIRIAPFYSLSEVQRLLKVSATTLRTMCDAWEPSTVVGRRRDSIESYLFAGGRRIPHHALIEFLAETSNYGVKDHD